MLYLSKSFIQYQYIDIKKSSKPTKDLKDISIFQKPKQQLSPCLKIAKFVSKRKFYNINPIENFKYYLYLNELKDRLL